MPFKMHKIIFVKKKIIKEKCVPTLPEMFRSVTQNTLLYFAPYMRYCYIPHRQAVMGQTSPHTFAVSHEPLLLVCTKYEGPLAFAHFLQLAMISFAHFLRFQLRTISHPNQEQLVISGRESMTCTGTRACAMKSVTFSLMVHLNFVQRSFFKCTIYMDYTVYFMYLKCS